VLTTGTGSGKLMSYIVPTVDRVLREGSGNGVRAIVMYPMNALVNSQRNERRSSSERTAPKSRSAGTPAKRARQLLLSCPREAALSV